jgi:hypothetical protein
MLPLHLYHPHFSAVWNFDKYLSPFNVLISTLKSLLRDTRVPIEGLLNDPSMLPDIPVSQIYSSVTSKFAQPNFASHGVATWTFSYHPLPSRPYVAGGWVMTF